MINPITSQKPKEEPLQWPQSYYMEKDPLIRQEIFNNHLKSSSDEQDDAFMKKLYDLRYDFTGPKPVDKFFAAWVKMGISYSNGVNFLNKKRVKKEVIQYMNDFAICPCPATNDSEIALLKKEWEAFFALVILMNQTDKTYSSVLFGVVPMKKDTLSTKIANELQDLTATLPEYLGLGEDFQPFHEVAAATYEKAYK